MILLTHTKFDSESNVTTNLVNELDYINFKEKKISTRKVVLISTFSDVYTKVNTDHIFYKKIVLKETLY
ncbi:unnamed protein product [Schistosoma curassoni]|uniref:Uncharacterized protein n=1 Tax=Schistosoma curassoni TaxID=6186 RepID=A0A183L680_9TREM|nr:unnamed protein product [Schistosoma curassoni]